MSIPVTCPNPECARRLRLKDDLAGRKVKCPDCGGLIQVPGGESKPDPMIGKRIAHYQILAKLGQGGMGAVYRARNIRLSKIVALKVLPAWLKERDRTFVERFIREAQSTAQLEHPNVVAVHFVGSDAGHYFIEMQYVDGKTLAEILRDPENISVSQATRIITDAARALGAAHSKGIVHRDVKPENIMLTIDGQVKVADFGLASLGETGDATTSEGKILGTPYYMSPEHCRGEATDARSDIYALGATYYHALTGHPPFFGNPGQDVVKMQVTTPIPPPKAALPTLPEPVNRIVTKMLEKDPDKRYQTCADLVNELVKVQGLLSPDSNMTAAFDEVEEVRRVSGLAKVAIGILVLGLIGAGVSAGIYLGGQTPKPKVKPAPPKPAPQPKPPQLPIHVPGTPGTETPAMAQVPGIPKLPSGPANAGTGPQSSPSDSDLPELPNLPSLPGADTAAAPEAKPDKPEAEPLPDVDLQEYAKAAYPIDEMTSERRYSAAAVKTNILDAKVKNAGEHARIKRTNIDLLKNRWKLIQEEVNSGKLKIPMKEISKRYGYAGTLVGINQNGLIGDTGKAKILVKWDRLSKSDILALWVKSCGTNDAESALTLAAFCMEGTEKLFEQTEVYLGMAAEHGASIKRLVRELGFLRKVSAFNPMPGEEIEKEKQAADEKKNTTKKQEPKKKPHRKEGLSENASHSYRKYMKPIGKYTLDSEAQLSRQGVRPQGRPIFTKGKKGGALALTQQGVNLPAMLPKEEGAIEFWIKLSGEGLRPFGLIWAYPPHQEGGMGMDPYPLTAHVQGNLRVTFKRPLGQPPSHRSLETDVKIEKDKWTQVAIEWGKRGYRIFVDGKLCAEDPDTSGLSADIRHIGFYRWLTTDSNQTAPKTNMLVLLDEVVLYFPKKLDRRK
ncbi:MAG: protein kinase [Planctomycetes bacterium]|nr:protein kinase [Planctomycetota bacterium]